jgi:hypothetical protein
MNEELQELKLMVPTYLAERFATEDSNSDQPDFGEPNVPVLIREAEGVRIVLGTHEYEDYEKPDIQIERRPNGWAIFLHPLGGSDPSGFVYFLDDGRSFLAKEYALGPTPAIEVLEAGHKVRELDCPSQETPDLPCFLVAQNPSCGGQLERPLWWEGLEMSHTHPRSLILANPGQSPPISAFERQSLPMSASHPLLPNRINGNPAS